jgi:hypothetical protein
MIKKVILAAAIAAIAVSFAPAASFAKKMHKQKVAKCGMGAMCTDKPDAKGMSRGWANVKACAPDGKMYRVIFGTCYVPSGMCAKKC